MSLKSCKGKVYVVIGIYNSGEGMLVREICFMK